MTKINRTIMKNKEKLGWVGLFILIMSPLLFAIFVWLTKGGERYTIGEVIDIRGTRGGHGPIYQYEINGKIVRIRGSANPIIVRKKTHEHIGKRYYIMFDETKPKHGRILLDYPVPDSIQFAPPNGWDSIPGIGQLENPLVWHAGKSPPVKKK